jgi:CRP/FNR family transcriptional regulator
MARTDSSVGPSLRAIPATIGPRNVVRILSPRQRSQLASIATQLHLPARTVVYREGSSAEAVFVVASGALKAFRDLPSGKQRVMAFLFQGDVFGLAEAGDYVNTVQAITPVRVHRLAMESLIHMLHRDADLMFQFLRKITHELRESQRQTVVVARRDAAGRLAMFLRMLERRTHAHGNIIETPMSRSDAANYLGLSLEAVSRACRMLERNGIVAFEGRRAVQVLDRGRLNKLAARL